MVSRPAVFGGPSRTTSRRPRPGPSSTQPPDRTQAIPGNPPTPNAPNLRLRLSPHPFLIPLLPPPPLPLVIIQCTLETPYPTSIPRTPRARPPPPTARPPDTPALSPPVPHLASRPVSDQPLPLETPPPQPLATSAHPASLAPSSRPLTAPTFVANPPKKPAQAISRQPESPLGIRAGER